MNASAALILLAFPAIFSGCVSTKYKMIPAAETTSPVPVAALQTVAISEVAANVDTVIVFRGPGSWKTEAYWDEYVVSLTNRSGEPLTIESAVLTGFQNDPAIAGDDPWLLEKSSKTWWQNVRSSETGRMLKLGGVTVLTGASAVGVALSGGIFGPTSASALAAANALALVTVAIPIYAVGSVVRNVSSRHEVEAEFKRRRLALPVSLTPDQSTKGSLFFRLTPGPQRLALTYRANGALREAVIDLTPIMGLHMAEPSRAPAVAAPKNVATR
jgi:hypothetical protein